MNKTVYKIRYKVKMKSLDVTKIVNIRQAYFTRTSCSSETRQSCSSDTVQKKLNLNCRLKDMPKRKQTIMSKKQTSMD